MGEEKTNEMSTLVGYQLKNTSTERQEVGDEAMKEKSKT